MLIPMDICLKCRASGTFDDGTFEYLLVGIIKWINWGYNYAVGINSEAKARKVHEYLITAKIP